MEIFREENWEKWENKDFNSFSIITRSPDKEKDRLLLTYLAVYGSSKIQKYAMRRLGTAAGFLTKVMPIATARTAAA